MGLSMTDMEYHFFQLFQVENNFFLAQYIFFMLKARQFVLHNFSQAT